MPAFALDNPNVYTNPFVRGLDYGTYFSASESGNSTATPNITYYLSGPGWTQLNAASAFRGALAGWAAVANVTFTEVAGATNATWVETLYNQPNSSTLGSHYLPNNDGLGGEFNRGHPIFTANSNLQGGLSYVTFLHELGHGLGLKHPFEPRPFPGVTVNDPYDPGDNNFNNGIYTVMGYDDAPFFADPGGLNFGYAGTPMAFDIAAIQAIYGPNLTTATGNNVYTIPTANASGTFWSSIWDAGGIDTITAAPGATTGATIDLRAATLQNSPGGGGWISRVDGIFGGVTIANAVVIENATGTNFADILRGNDVANVLQGLDGSDQLFGGAGNDTLRGGTGVDIYDGGAGNDQFYIDAVGETVTELLNGGTDTVRSAIANYTLSNNVERLILETGAANGTGNALANVLTGNDAANILRGLDGNDALISGAGNDVLYGGAGRDTFTGGAGRDYFVFVPGDFLGLANTQIDIVSDFAKADLDRIDLRQIDAIEGGANNRFTFIDTAEFSNVAGQLRYEVRGANTFIEGDVNGDGVIDFVVRLNGIVDLEATDFFL